jgi:sulfate adenylyltransferase
MRRATGCKGSAPSVTLRQGCTVFFTGLPSAGKSTLATDLVNKLRELRVGGLVLFDGDAVRKGISSDLGFSWEDRNTNIRRIGQLALEVTRGGGVAVCAAIAPFDDVRKEVRHLIREAGTFVLVHVSTPLEVCEARDPKGLDTNARKGTILNFTGISDPYEIPADADVSINTAVQSREAGVHMILSYLEQAGAIIPQSAIRDV